MQTYEKKPFHSKNRFTIEERKKKDSITFRNVFDKSNIIRNRFIVFIICIKRQSNVFSFIPTLRLFDPMMCIPCICIFICIYNAIDDDRNLTHLIGFPI